MLQDKKIFFPILKLLEGKTVSKKKLLFICLFSGRCLQMFSSHTQEGTFNDGSPPSGGSRIAVEAGEAESHCHRRPWHGEGHSAVSGCTGGHSEWQGAPAWARRLHSVCGARQHQAGAAPSSWGEKPDRWLLTEEQVWRDAPHLYRGETALIACCGDYTQFIGIHQYCAGPTLTLR